MAAYPLSPATIFTRLHGLMSATCIACRRDVTSHICRLGNIKRILSCQDYHDAFACVHDHECSAYGSSDPEVSIFSHPGGLGEPLLRWHHDAIRPFDDPRLSLGGLGLGRIVRPSSGLHCSPPWAPTVASLTPFACVTRRFAPLPFFPFRVCQPPGCPVVAAVPEFGGSERGGGACPQGAAPRPCLWCRVCPCGCPPS